MHSKPSKRFANNTAMTMCSRHCWLLPVLVGVAHAVTAADQPTLLAVLQADDELSMFTSMLGTSLAAQLSSTQAREL
jgi:hypothetical protein